MVQITLFAGKVAFLLVLYAFVLLVVKSAVKDLKAQQQARAPQGYSVSAAAAPPGGMAATRGPAPACTRAWLGADRGSRSRPASRAGVRGASGRVRGDRSRS